jgi:GxxExxY protein
VKCQGLTDRIIGAAIAVHRELGPGLLESTYEACLVFELARRSVHVERQCALPVLYQGIAIDCAYRIDLLVERQVVVELKAIERIERVHIAQMLTYLRLSGCRVGLLINFNVALLKDGIQRLSL